MLARKRAAPTASSRKGERCSIGSPLRNSRKPSIVLADRAAAPLANQQDVSNFKPPKRRHACAIVLRSRSKIESPTAFCSSGKCHAATTEASITSGILLPALVFPGDDFFDRHRFRVLTQSPECPRLLHVYRCSLASSCGAICATILPCRVIAIVSPCSTSSSNSENLAFASEDLLMLLSCSFRPVNLTGQSYRKCACKRS